MTDSRKKKIPWDNRNHILFRQGGKGKESLQLHLWNLKFTSNSPVALRQRSFQISANQHEAKTNANVNKHWKTCAKGNGAITYVISTNQHFILTFSKQIFKFQRCSCKLSFLFPPHCQSNLESFLASYQANCNLFLSNYRIVGPLNLLLENCSPQSHSCDLLGRILI